MIGRDEDPCWAGDVMELGVSSRRHLVRDRQRRVHDLRLSDGHDERRGAVAHPPSLSPPLMEGASLIVFYAAKAPPNTVSGSPSGTVLVNSKPYTGGPIPYGAKVDVTKGAVTLSPAEGTLTASGGGGITAQFILVRAKDAGKPIVELQLTGGDFNACAKRAAQARGKTAKTVRRLWAKGNGKFRTRGAYASAAIRGTDWLTADRCDGTLVQVREGVVSAFDLVLKKTVLVNAGQSYVAKKKPSTASPNDRRRLRRPDGLPHCRRIDLADAICAGVGHQERQPQCGGRMCRCRGVPRPPVRTSWKRELPRHRRRRAAASRMPRATASRWIMVVPRSGSSTAPVSRHRVVSRGGEARA